MWNRRKFIKSALVAAATLPAVTRGLAAENGQTYTVQRGDTLTGISQRFGVTIDELRARNGLQSDRINIGQLLIIRPPPAPARIYVVESGDTLGEIARRHNTTVHAIQSANKLTGDRIFPGQELTIPGGAAGASRDYISGVVSATEKLRVRQRRWQYIVAHHSGVNSGNAAIYDRFHRRHMGMPNGLAYHFVIGNGSDSGNGEIEIGNRWTKQLQGGHVRNARVNDVGIGICLVGNFETRHPTSRQVAALTELIHYLKYELHGGRPSFTVHREVDGSRTLCPGRNFPTARMHQIFS